MKSLADLVRRLQVGVRVELTYCSFRHLHINVVRTIVSRNSVGIGLSPEPKQGARYASWLDIFKTRDTIEFPEGKHNSFRLIDETGGVMEYRIYD